MDNESESTLGPGMMADIFCFNVLPLKSVVFFLFFLKLSQNKTEPQIEHRGKEWKNQEQNKTEGHTEWEEGEEEDPQRAGETQATDQVSQRTRRSFPQDSRAR